MNRLFPCFASRRIIVLFAFSFFALVTHSLILCAQNPPPLITSFSPTSGPVGTSVRIVGRSFLGTGRVTFGGVSASSYGALSSGGDSITAVVPAGAQTGVITITTGAGTGASTMVFTVTTPPTPTITGFTPTSGAPGTVIIVTGTNLTGATSVSIGGAPATYTVNRDGTVSVTVPANAASGVVSITTPNGTATSGRTTFTVLSPVPTITGFSPTSGSPGTTITITGTNFTGTSLVAIGGRASAFTVVSPTTIRATIPAGIPSGNTPIIVITPAGQVMSSMTLQVITSIRVAFEHSVQLFPQPSSDDQTTLEYTLSQPSLVQTEIVNSLGASVVKYAETQQGSGIHRITIETKALAQGVYFVRVNIGGKIATVPLQVVR